MDLDDETPQASTSANSSPLSPSDNSSSQQQSTTGHFETVDDTVIEAGMAGGSSVLAESALCDEVEGAPVRSGHSQSEQIETAKLRNIECEEDSGLKIDEGGAVGIPGAGSCDSPSRMSTEPRPLDDLFNDDIDVIDARDGIPIAYKLKSPPTPPRSPDKKADVVLSSDDENNDISRKADKRSRSSSRPVLQPLSAKALGKRRASFGSRPSQSDEGADSSDLEIDSLFVRSPHASTSTSQVRTSSSKKKPRVGSSMASQEHLAILSSDDDDHLPAGKFGVTPRRLSGSTSKSRDSILRLSAPQAPHGSEQKPLRKPKITHRDNRSSSVEIVDTPSTSAQKAKPLQDDEDDDDDDDDEIFERDSESAEDSERDHLKRRQAQEKKDRDKKRAERANREKIANEAAEKEAVPVGQAARNETALEAARRRVMLRQQNDAKRGIQPKIRRAPLPGDSYDEPLQGQAREMDDEEFRANEADLQEFRRRAANVVNAAKSSSVAEALEKLGMQDVNEIMPGLRMTLLEFQLIFLAWAEERELADNAPGGCLCDDMGLGKTVQMIALMARRRSTEPEIKTNLIIVPLSLLAQWESEIRTKAIGFKVHVYHGSNKAIAKSPEQLEEFDVVITTHGRVMSEWPKKGSEFNPGNLFQMTWFRVIIDEAHVIRNKRTQVSRAVAQLDAVYRWCLTGTPVVNTLQDLFPLMRFLRYKPWCDFNFFKMHILKDEKRDPVEAGRAADEALAPIRKRRLKSDKLENGKDLVELPAKHDKFHAIEFDAAEREAYDNYEKEAQITVSRYFKKGTLLKNWSHVFVLILRLRQLTVHPSLVAVEGSGGAVDFAEEIARAEKLLGKAKVAAMKKRLLDEAVARARALEVKPEAVADDDEDGVCSICLECLVPATGVITVCEHTFCRTCIEEVLHGAPNLDEDDSATGPCPNCRAPLTRDKMFELDAFAPSIDAVDQAMKTIVIDDSDSDDLPEDLSFVKREPGGRAAQAQAQDGGIKPKKKQRRRPTKDTTLKAFAESGYVPSSKMSYCFDKVEEYRREDPTIKTIIISSFVQALDLMDSYLSFKGVACCRYQGSLSQVERAETIHRFKTDPDCRVMLLSLKAGGVGLNLTCASRVLNLDAAWSRSVENQAIDRTYRLGQDREVFIERLTAVDSIEERIHKLQDRKMLLADMALEEGQGAKDFTGKISVPEILSLFRLSAKGEPPRPKNQQLRAR